MGPRLALSVFVAAQGVVGFIMSGCYAQLGQAQNIPAFVIVYGSKFVRSTKLRCGADYDCQSSLCLVKWVQGTTSDL